MKSKKGQLKKLRLYVILDKTALRNKDILVMAEKIKDAGPAILQYRDKQSKKEDILRRAFTLRKILQKSKHILIINDYLDVAKISDADGLHLGQDDLPLQIARKILGPDKIIGISCHNLKQAIKAQKNGADYIGLGPVFKTPTKPKYPPVGLGLIKKCSQRLRVPFFAIGNINQGNIRKVLSSGAKRVAVCRAILEDKKASQATRNFCAILN